MAVEGDVTYSATASVIPHAEDFVVRVQAGGAWCWSPICMVINHVLDPSRPSFGSWLWPAFLAGFFTRAF